MSQLTEKYKELIEENRRLRKTIERLRFINQEFGIPDSLERDKRISDFVDRGELPANECARERIEELNLKVERYEAIEEAAEAFAALVARYIRR